MLRGPTSRLPEPCLSASSFIRIKYSSNLYCCQGENYTRIDAKRRGKQWESRIRLMFKVNGAKAPAADFALSACKIFSSSLAQPFEDGSFHLFKLPRIERTHLAKSPGCWVGGDALRNKSAVFEKRNIKLHLELGTAQRSTVENHSEYSAIRICERDAEN